MLQKNSKGMKKYTSERQSVLCRRSKILCWKVLKVLYIRKSLKVLKRLLWIKNSFKAFRRWMIKFLVHDHKSVAQDYAKFWFSYQNFYMKVFESSKMSLKTIWIIQTTKFLVNDHKIVAQDYEKRENRLNWGFLVVLKGRKIGLKYKPR